jgi:hypothetical protein
MASAGLSRRVEKVVGYPPLSEMGEHQRREFHKALLDADSFEDLAGKWQAAILKAEQNRPRARRTTGLRRTSSPEGPGRRRCASARTRSGTGVRYALRAYAAAAGA